MELLGQSDCRWVVVVEHVLLNFREDFDHWFALDRGAIDDPGDESAHRLLIKLSTLVEKWSHLFVPVLVVDCIASCIPFSHNCGELSVPLYVLGSDVVSVDCQLVVVEVHLPFGCWKRLFNEPATARAAHVVRAKVSGVVASASRWVAVVPITSVAV